VTPPLHRPRRQWHVVPGVGHVLQAERAQPVAEAMARFLARPPITARDRVQLPRSSALGTPRADGVPQADGHPWPHFSGACFCVLLEEPGGIITTGRR
jgi:hypothetical protein